MLLWYNDLKKETISKPIRLDEIEIVLVYRNVNYDTLIPSNGKPTNKLIGNEISYFKEDNQWFYMLSDKISHPHIDKFLTTDWETGEQVEHWLKYYIKHPENVNCEVGSLLTYHLFMIAKQEGHMPDNDMFPFQITLQEIKRLAPFLMQEKRTIPSSAGFFKGLPADYLNELANYLEPRLTFAEAKKKLDEEIKNAESFYGQIHA